MKHSALFLTGIASLTLTAGCETPCGRGGERPPQVRIENFTVPPSTGPVTHVVVQNPSDCPFEGLVRLTPPDGWRLSPSQQPVALEPGEAKRVPFTVEKATDEQSNSYPMEVLVSGATAELRHQQRVVCCSAPRLTAVIDGDPSEWKDAIPVTFRVGDRRTVLRTYWDRRYFYLLVEVEEERLVGYSSEEPTRPFDAVQFALSRRSSSTGLTETDLSARYEFLVASSASPPDRAVSFCLLQPGETLAVTRQRRNFNSLEFPEAQVAVTRDRSVTSYECAVPFASMPALRPRVGREFCFSVLVHDPDGTGVRDWGEAAGLGAEQRNRLAWCVWASMTWGDRIPFDNKLGWGLCSSKY